MAQRMAATAVSTHHEQAGVEAMLGFAAARDGGDDGEDDEEMMAEVVVDDKREASPLVECPPTMLHPVLLLCAPLSPSALFSLRCWGLF